MKTLLFAVSALLCSGRLHAQDDKLQKALVEEGKALYQTEMASWHGTDLFLARFPERRDQVGGYFSYRKGTSSTCVFFDRQPTPQVTAVISFDASYDPDRATIDTTRKVFTKQEQQLYSMRLIAGEEIRRDTMFKAYENTNFNIIPFIWKGEKKVYVLTCTTLSNVVIFGNDYLITLDKKNRIISSKSLHHNIMGVPYESGKDDEGAVHSHLPESGDYITVTDICTLMLYSGLAGWDTYVVMSAKYMNLWNCKTNTLIVLPNTSFRQIIEENENR